MELFFLKHGICSTEQSNTQRTSRSSSLLNLTNLEVVEGRCEELRLRGQARGAARAARLPRPEGGRQGHARVGVVGGKVVAHGESHVQVGLKGGLGPCRNHA